MSNAHNRDWPPPNQEILELLAGEVLGDLDDAEAAQLASLEGSADVQQARADLERTAAAVQLACLGLPSDPLPSSLRMRIESDAGKVIPRSAAPDSSVTSLVGSDVDQHAPTLARTVDDRLSAGKTGVSAREWMAWLSCAAAILIACGLWWSRPQSSSATLSSLEARDVLLQEADDLVQVSWDAGKTPFENQVGGDVVWSNARQEGFMRFVDMPVNDPTQQQYQLWIIDPARDDEPIDGGVFDITSDGEVVVPIQAKLEVISPVAFAITVEKPGGVVVSTQENLPLLAAVN